MLAASSTPASTRSTATSARTPRRILSVIRLPAVAAPAAPESRPAGAESSPLFVLRRRRKQQLDGLVERRLRLRHVVADGVDLLVHVVEFVLDRKSTRLNSSH